jgi:hypothetical protein
MSIFLTGRRSATTTLAQIHAYDLNLCTDLHCSRRTLTLAAPRSCAATSSTNALMGVGCHQPVRLPRANPHSARGTTACHFPRFRSLKAFGRRPRCTPRRRDRPASETLNNRYRRGPNEMSGFTRSGHRREVRSGFRRDRHTVLSTLAPVKRWWLGQQLGQLGHVGGDAPGLCCGACSPAPRCSSIDLRARGRPAHATQGIRTSCKCDPALAICPQPYGLSTSGGLYQFCIRVS